MRRRFQSVVGRTLKSQYITIQIIIDLGTKRKKKLVDSRFVQFGFRNISQSGDIELYCIGVRYRTVIYGKRNNVTFIRNTTLAYNVYS